MQTTNQLPPHHVHHVCQNIKDAEAVAYALTTDDGPLVQYPFKFNSLGDEEVRMKVIRTALCHTDCIMSRNKWGPHRKPCVVGHEIVGIVSILGKKVTGFTVGQRVGVSPQRYSCGECEFCRKAKEGCCQKAQWTYIQDSDNFGGYATHFQGHYRHVYKLPENLPSDAAGPLMCAGITVWQPLTKWGKPGLTCAVIGIGGLGHLALQYASKFGMVVTAFSSTPNKEEFCKKLGANDVKSSLDDSVLKAEAGKYDIVVTTFCGDGDEIWQKHMSLTKTAGVFCILGVPPQCLVKLNVMEMVWKQIIIAGTGAPCRYEIEECLKFSADNKIYPIIENYPFEKFPEAFDKLENGKPMLRIVVNVEDWAKKNGFDK